jgi:ankyrin repeat protein
LSNRFRWVFCQLEILRHCLPWAVRRTLEELPESLDETYARILKEIKTPNRDYACRLLQCLVAAIRPLRMEELAEVLAIDFNDEGGVPKLNPRWRWEDQEQALLSSCSSLITIVEVGESRVVQFSHSSVKEFLTSLRLAIWSRDDLSRYHILLEPAHAILAQACVSILLQSDDRVVKVGTDNRSPLAPYAARHWVSHAQFGHVSSHIKGMAYLFDNDRPHFRSWLRLFDIDTKPDAGSIFPMFISFDESEASPLYYAALCGFLDLAKHIIDKRPQHINACGGYYMTPLVAALAGRHFKTAQLLYDHGADPNVRCYDEGTPLHAAVQSGDSEIVQRLIEYNADVNAQNRIGWTPLHIASRLVQPNIDVVQLLLERGVDVDARAKDGSTALHEASAYGTPEVVRLLLEHGANVDLKDNNGRTPHQTVSGTRRDKFRKLGFLKRFTPDFNVEPFNTAQGSTTPSRSTTTQNSQQSSRRIMYLQHVSSSSILDRLDLSDTDLSSNVSLPRSSNSG